MALGDEQGLIWIRDVHSGEVLQVLEGHEAGVSSIAWDGAGQRIVSGSVDRSVRVWDVGSGQVQVLEGHKGSVTSVAWDGTGQRAVSGSTDHTVRIWDSDTGKALYVLEGHSRLVAGVAWDKTGQWVASGSYDMTVRIWDAGSGESLRVLNGGHDSCVTSVAWDRTGRRVASGSNDNTVRIWDAGTGRVLRVLKGHQHWVISVAWDRTGRRVVSGCSDGTVRIWGAGTGQTLQVLKGHRNPVRSVVWDGAGRRIASVSGDNTVLIWDVGTGDTVKVLGCHQDLVTSLAWDSTRQRVACGAYNSTVRIWDARTGNALQVLKGDREFATSVAWDRMGQRVASASEDAEVRIWDAGTGKALHVLKGHHSAARSIGWDETGQRVASGSIDGTVRIWDANSGQSLQVLKGHEGSVKIVAWDGTGQRVASASDETVRIWNADSGKTLQVLRGHREWITSLAWDVGGQRVASGSYDNTVRIWDAATGEALQVFEGHPRALNRVAWLDAEFVVSSDLGGGTILWNLLTQEIVARYSSPGWIPAFTGPCPSPIVERQLGDFIRIRRLTSLAATHVESVRFRSMKVVFVGESDKGKTSLALRLVEDRYEETGTTPGMQIWTLAPARLGQESTDEQREIFLWDFGGQPEYQLIHQAFLHDTTLAIFLFDPTRGEQDFEDVEKWSRRLEAQLKGRKAVKILVRSKLDQKPEFVVDSARIDLLKREHGFDRYIEVSAKEPERGFQAFKEELAKHIDWEQIAVRCRLKLWQSVYEVITKARSDGAVLLSIFDLKKRLADPDLNEADLEAAVESLAQQGLVVRLDNFGGSPVLILGVDHIDRYAGCLVRAARLNPRQIPAVEESALEDPQVYFEIPEHQRVSQPEARSAVISAVKQLLIDKSLAFRSHGLLIFPSEYITERPTGAGDLLRTVPLHFRFEGSGANIYASTVCVLEQVGRFGGLRLWRNWAQFEEGDDICALHLVERGPGQAKLEMGFGPATSQLTQDAFIAAVEDHLRFERVEVTHGHGFPCSSPCNFIFTEETVSQRLERGQAEITCPTCDTKYPIFKHSPRKREVEPRIDPIPQPRIPSVPKPTVGDSLQILHLSDLHFLQEDDANVVLQPLLTDLREFPAIEYLVVSGDLSDKANPKGFEHAERFLKKLLDELKLTQERVVMTPGNHDVDESVEVHGFAPKKRVPPTAKEPLSLGGDVYRFQLDEKYPERFERYRAVHHRITGVDYPLDPEKQCLSRPYEVGLQFLTLNSAWQIDEYNRARIGLNPSARANGMEELRQASVRTRFRGNKVLRIAIWHHAIDGDRKIPDPDLAYLELLADEGFALVLHGDVHEVRAGVANPFNRGIYVVGAGSLHSAWEGRPESTPCLYNILEVDRDFKRIRVQVRAQERRGGRFDEYARWPHPTGSGKVGYFDIQNPRTWSVPASGGV